MEIQQDDEPLVASRLYDPRCRGSEPADLLVGKCPMQTGMICGLRVADIPHPPAKAVGQGIVRFSAFSI